MVCTCVIAVVLYVCLCTVAAWRSFALCPASPSQTLHSAPKSRFPIVCVCPNFQTGPENPIRANKEGRGKERIEDMY